MIGDFTKMCKITWESVNLSLKVIFVMIVVSGMTIVGNDTQ